MVPTLAHLSIQFSTYEHISQAPYPDYMAQQSHILHPKYPYLEPFYVNSAFYCLVWRRYCMNIKLVLSLHDTN